MLAGWLLSLAGRHRCPERLSVGGDALRALRFFRDLPGHPSEVRKVSVSSLERPDPIRCPMLEGQRGSAKERDMIQAHHTFVYSPGDLPMPTPDDVPIDIDDKNAVLAAAVRAIAVAVKKAVAENDALGIPSPVGVNGTVRYVLNGRLLDDA